MSLAPAPVPAVLSIQASVGKFEGGTRQCFNLVKDQLTVIKLLNRISTDDGGAAGNLTEDPSFLQSGFVLEPLFEAILTFQKVQSGLSLDGHVDPGEKTILRLNELAFPSTPGTSVPDPRTDPNELLRILKLLELHRPFVPIMIKAVLDALPKCQEAFNAFFEDPLKAAVLESQNLFAIDGLFRFFHVDRNNHKFFLPTIIANFEVLRSKVGRLPLDQFPIDFANAIVKAPELRSGTTMTKTPAFTVSEENAMFFTPVYRPLNTSLPEPFTGFLPESLRGIQLHEMGHLYLGLPKENDRNPINLSAQQCLTNNPSYEFLARQITFRTRVRFKETK